jgi:hypothetical protein
MYSYDLCRKNIINSPQTRERLSVDRWGNSIINMTWQMDIECWISRNSIEHKTDNNRTQIKKEKEIEKTLCLKGKLPNNQEILEKQPFDNLTMITEQFSVMMHKKINM